VCRQRADFGSTLVGGSEAISDLPEAPELEVWPVEPDGSPAFDTDVINS
jgi:hypothetical protein